MDAVAAAGVYVALPVDLYPIWDAIVGEGVYSAVALYARLLVNVKFIAADA